ncbi:MAG: hypothetical protein ACP5J4_05145 [Anaerolineae bacterium]
MLRSTLKRNLFPIALITLGGLICVAIILYVFRAYLAIVVWVLLGLLMIGVGVLGIVASNPKNKLLAGGEPSRSSKGKPGTPPPSITPPKSSAARTKKIGFGQQDTITISKPVLVGGGVLVASLVLMLLCNVGTALRSLLTVRRTQIVDCREASLYAEEGWRFVSAYSYRLEDEVSSYTEHTDCVMEREQFVWAKDTHAPEEDVAIDETFTNDMDTDSLDPTAYWEPTQTYPPQSAPTQKPLPTSTVGAVSSPLPTWTPPPSPTPLPTVGPTATPLALSPTPSPVPRTDIDVCEVTSNDSYLNTYVQWEGVIIDTPTFEEDGLWFQIQWTNSDTSSECSQAIFFVSYDGDERFFEEDKVAVTGTIIDTTYKHEEEVDETAYFVVVKADYVEFLGEQ